MHNNVPDESDDDGDGVDNDFIRVPNFSFPGLEDMPKIPEVYEEEEASTQNEPPPRTYIPASLSASLSSAASLKDVPLHNDADEPFGSGTPAPFVVGGGGSGDDGNDEDDIEALAANVEALAAKACALASVPIPDYADAFQRKNKKYELKKYRDRDQRKRRKDKDPNSIILANKTSDILSEFKSYVSKVETEQTAGALDILNAHGSNDNNGRSDGNESRGLIVREWSYNDDKNNPPYIRRKSTGDGSLLRFLDEESVLAADDASTSSAIPAGDGEDGKNTNHDDDDDEDFSDNRVGLIISYRHYHHYWHTVFRSKKFKIGTVWVILACVLVGAFIGISSSGGNTENSEEELLARVGGLDLARSPSPHHEEVDRLGDGGEEEEEEDPPRQHEPKNGEAVKDAFDHVVAVVGSPPMDRTEGRLPPDRDGAVGTPPPSDPATGRAPNAWNDDSLEQYVAEKYAPKWFARVAGWGGSTYTEAVHFCASQGMAICPYDAICPGGPTHGVYQDNTRVVVSEEGGGSNKEQWIPISDEANEWVQAGPYLTCMLYRDVYSDPPDWGISGGTGNEIVTQYVMCCKADELGVEDQSQSQMDSTHDEHNASTTSSVAGSNVGDSYHDETLGATLEEDFPTYRAKWFSRSDGWTGQTYDEAWIFCMNGHHMTICPYDAYCPMAQLGVPFDGPRDEQNRTSWAPIGDAYNGWVSVGVEKACSTYESLHDKPADWGISGLGAEPLTRHIMCCEAEATQSRDPRPTSPPAPVLPPVKEVGSQFAPLPSEEPNSTAIANPSSKAPEEATAATDVSASVLTYRAIWHDRSSGWTGQTYDEAFSFCSKIPGHDLCPYEVYCPLGESGEPYGNIMIDEPYGSWAPVSDDFNEWVRVSGDNNTCALFTSINPGRPNWGLTGEDNEEVTRHIMCCETDNLEGDASAVVDVDEKYAPTWYHRDKISGDGWFGKTYTDAIAFCALKDSGIPCPYEAICPDGPGGMPTGGSREAQEAWAPIMDIPNGWVNVGSSSDSCELYNSIHSSPPLWGLVGRLIEGEQFLDIDVMDITADIMCCREPLEGDTTTTLQTTASSIVPVASTSYEQDILDKHHPIWFSRKHGYGGTTHEEAAAFCKGIGDMVLCPREAYCPETSEKPLFFQRDPFTGEQWAPVESSDTRPGRKWILVGPLDGESQSTCATFDDVKGMKPRGWSVDTSDSGLKENVLCCLNPNHLIKEINFAKTLDRIWLDESYGWNGGSHDDAKEFCQKLGGNKRLCPYTAYCPHGPGQPVIGGHDIDFNMEGEQWAPVNHESSYWVMIGRKYGNSATTCMDNWELEGREPPTWGTSNERADLKKHIMCCSLS